MCERSQGYGVMEFGNLNYAQEQSLVGSHNVAGINIDVARAEV